MHLHRKLSCVSAPLAVLLLTPLLAAQGPTADLIMIHGHILTVDDKDSVAQAIAIRRGVIAKVGSDAEVMEFTGNAVTPSRPGSSTPTPTLRKEASTSSTA